MTALQPLAFGASLSRPVLDQLLRRFKLTRREMEAAIYIAEGLHAKEIAEHMSCSEKTVYAHLARVSQKARCRDYHELVCILLHSACRIILEDREVDSIRPSSV